MKNKRSIQLITCIIGAILLVLTEMLPCKPSFAIAQPKNGIKSWNGLYVTGEVITENDLAKILEEHKKWIEDEKEGKQADLGRANLSGADLFRANLYKANLYKANLYKANLHKANLNRANLSRANLREAILSGTTLNKAKLIGANLSKVNLSEASLFEADLSSANLREADLRETNLFGTNLNKANLRGVIFQPKLESISKIKKIHFALNLSELTYRDRQNSLVYLRREFKKGGMRKQEREITYAKKSTERKKLWESGDIFTKVESLFNYFFFELTCKYGMSPSRPLKILFGAIFIFWVLYIKALQPEDKDGIWIVWIAERARKDLTKDTPYRLKCFGDRALCTGLYFSVLSAFNIGWRELNFGNWISRMQRREYVLKPTGWVRTVSGIQSILSVYLLALWVLSYFGRPFDW